MDAGLEKFGARAAMVRRRASTCFAFMLPENKVRAVDLFAQTEGVWRGVSPPTRESRLGRMVWAPACNPNPMYIRACRRACFANGSPFRRRSPASEGGPATLPAWKLTTLTFNSPRLRTVCAFFFRRSRKKYLDTRSPTAFAVPRESPAYYDSIVARGTWCYVLPCSRVLLWNEAKAGWQQSAEEEKKKKLSPAN